MKIISRPERKRFYRFAFVGTIGAAIDFTVFNLLIQLAGFAPVWASVCSFSAAVVSNFTWNRYWTYPDSRTKRVPRQLAEFFAVNLIGVLIRTPIFAYLEPRTVRLAGVFFNGFQPIQEFIGHNSALALSMILVLFWNFFINRYWTYADIAPVEA
jgi:putative flippase GtrA